MRFIRLGLTVCSIVGVDCPLREWTRLIKDCKNTKESVMKSAFVREFADGRYKIVDEPIA